MSKLCETNKNLGKPVYLMLFLRLPKPVEEVLGSKDYDLISKYFPDKDIIKLIDGYDSWGGLIKENDLPQDNKFYQNKYDQSKAPCCELYRRINILYDGKVNSCICRDLNADLKIGDITFQTIYGIWSGIELKKLRENWINGNVPEICKGCERYLPVDVYYADRFWNIVKKYFKKMINRTRLQK